MAPVAACVSRTFSKVEANGIVGRNGPIARPAALTGKGSMFTIIRKFRLKRGSAVEVSRRVREGFVPLLQELPGFRGYYLLEGGPDVLISVRVFDSADEALASNEIAATWMRENVLEFVKGMPEVMAGNVLVAAPNKPTGD
jgi:antibiotic biosynthesis monooxygenase